MKSMVRLAVLALVVALLVGGVSLPVRAQGDAPNPCFDLKADDCKLLTDGGAALSKVTSLNMDWKLSLKTAGTGQDGDVTLTGKGSITVPASTGAGSDSGGAVGAAMAGLNDLQFQNAITSSGKMGKDDLSGSLEFRIVGGVLYFMSDKLTGGKWQGVKLDQQEMMGSMMGLTGGAGGNSPLGANNPATALMSDPNFLPALMAAPTIPGVIKVARADDMDATDKSEKYAVINYDVDLATLFKAKEFLPVIKAIATQAMSTRTSSVGGAATPPAIPEMTDEQAAQFAAMAATAVKDVKIRATVWVGLDSKTVRGLALVVNAKIDPAANPMIAAALKAKTPISFDFSVGIEFSKLGAGDKVEAVKDAKISTLSEVLGPLMGGLGGLTPSSK